MDRRTAGLATALLLATLLAGCAHAPPGVSIPDVIPGLTIGCIDPIMESAADSTAVKAAAVEREPSGERAESPRFPGKPINYEPRICGVIPHGERSTMSAISAAGGSSLAQSGGPS